MTDPDPEPEPEQATAHQTYIKMSVVIRLRKNKGLWTAWEKELHSRDPTYFPSKSVMIKRAVYELLGEEWEK